MIQNGAKFSTISRDSIIKFSYVVFLFNVIHRINVMNAKDIKPIANACFCTKFCIDVDDILFITYNKNFFNNYFNIFIKNYFILYIFGFHFS